MKLLRSLAVLVAGATWLAAAEPDDVPTLPLGAAAPDFTLPGVDGRQHSLQEFAAAQVLVIVFTCNHCPTAQYYEERLKQLAADYRDRAVALVAISPNDPHSIRLDELGYTDLSDSFEEMKIRARDRQFNFPYLYDGDSQAAARAYGPVATPHVFIFDADRKLRYVGRIDDDERGRNITRQDAREAIEALLAGRDVAVPQTKVFGCSIKWKGKEQSVKDFMARLAAEPVRVTPIDAQGLRALRQNPSGKLRLVNFWATWCGPCLTEFPDLVTIHRMYRHRDFELVTVAANYPDEEPEVLAWLKKQQASNPNFLFGTPEKYKLIEAFDPDWSGALPYSLLLAPDGQVLYRREGPIDALALKRLIVQTLNARKPW
jgi:thiol-disulfide isomerase/thioredoxin